MKNILVTGANKGIGQAICRRLICDREDVHVILGSRDADRGSAALNAIAAEFPSAEDQISLLPIDVACDESVSSAAAQVKEKFSNLYGIVNNAGIGTAEHYSDMINVNFWGPKRVFDNFKGLLQDGGRVVNMSSAAGPVFVDQIPDNDVKRMLASCSIEWEQLQCIVNDYNHFRTTNDGFDSPTLGNVKKDYGFSKALLNSLTAILARAHPNFVINSCTPGFIATDMTQSFWVKSGKSPEEIGCLPATEGTKSAFHLLFNITSSGCYYGSDCLRSPLDRYRGPGDPEYQPEEN